MRTPRTLRWLPGPVAAGLAVLVVTVVAATALVPRSSGPATPARDPVADSGARRAAMASVPTARLAPVPRAPKVRIDRVQRSAAPAVSTPVRVAAPARVARHDDGGEAREHEDEGQGREGEDD